jgi:hypothetical protein
MDAARRFGAQVVANLPHALLDLVDEKGDFPVAQLRMHEVRAAGVIQVLFEGVVVAGKRLRTRTELPGRERLAALQIHRLEARGFQVFENEILVVVLPHR